MRWLNHLRGKIHLLLYLAAFLLFGCAMTLKDLEEKKGIWTIHVRTYSAPIETVFPIAKKLTYGIFRSKKCPSFMLSFHNNELNKIYTYAHTVYGIGEFYWLITMEPTSQGATRVELISFYSRGCSCLREELFKGLDAQFHVIEETSKATGEGSTSNVVPPEKVNQTDN